jgi:DNA-binding beta-propeller fold protein YncE
MAVRLPYGFDFTPDGTLIVTEAFGGEVGAAAASSYSLIDAGRLASVSGSIADTRSEVCWAAVTNDGRFAYVTNFGDGTVSSYAIDADAQKVYGWTVESDGALVLVGAVKGVPETVAGLAAT